MSALIEFDEVCKYYQMGDTIVKAADHISMKIEKGEFVAIVGQSGSGKSTCMNIIGCLDVPTQGTYLLNGRDVGKMNRNELAAIRNEMLGFIFQQYNLLPKLNLMENVEVPLVYAGVSRAERHKRAKEVLEKVGLGDKLKNKPNQLSGGQQQRVSIARALVRNPPLILADEPTGALDSHTGREVLGMLQDLHGQGHTVVLITHDNSIAVQDKNYVGTVTRVSMKGTSNGGTTTYPVTIRIDETDGLRPGMNANAEIVVAEAANALTVPNAAIVRGGYVLVTQDSPSASKADTTMEAPEGFVYVAVKTGVSDDDYTQIVSGIQEGDTIGYDPNSVSSDSYYDDGGSSMMIF